MSRMKNVIWTLKTMPWWWWLLLAAGITFTCVVSDNPWESFGKGAIAGLFIGALYCWWEHRMYKKKVREIDAKLTAQENQHAKTKD